MKTINSNRGMTLVEILFAAAIIVTTTVAILQFYLSTLNLSEINKEANIAAFHLTAMTEAIKCTPFSEITVDFPDGVTDGMPGNNYATIVGGYILKDEHIVVTYVDPDSDPLEVNVGVSWQDKRGVELTRYLVTKRTR